MKKAQRKELTKNLKVKKDYLELIPRPISEEYQVLKEDIKEKGIETPISINTEKFILDGYTRVQIAEELGIEEVPIEFMDFGSELEEIYFVVRRNLKRRHLTADQKCEIGLLLLEAEEREAKKRQQQQAIINNPKIDKCKNPPILAHFDKYKGEAIEIVAKRVGVGKTTLSRDSKVFHLVEMGWTQEEVAEIMGLERSAISKIVKNFNAKLFHILELGEQEGRSVSELSTKTF